VFDLATSAHCCALSLHDALPICDERRIRRLDNRDGDHRALHAAALRKLLDGELKLTPRRVPVRDRDALLELHALAVDARPARHRSEEHTSELQSRENLVCRLLLE